jgi:hypothetical protein
MTPLWLELPVGLLGERLHTAEKSGVAIIARKHMWKHIAREIGKKMIAGDIADFRKPFDKFRMFGKSG